MVRDRTKLRDKDINYWFCHEELVRRSVTMSNLCDRLWEGQMYMDVNARAALGDGLHGVAAVEGFSIE